MTLDEAFDGIAHCLEVFHGVDPDKYDLAKEVAEAGIELVVENNVIIDASLVEEYMRLILLAAKT